MSLTKKVFSTKNLYMIDYQHIGLSIMIENVQTLFQNIFDFRSVYVSTYDKFIAGLQKIPISDQNLKHIVLFGNEGPVIPSLLIDPQSVESDDNVSNLFFNFFKFSNIYSSVSSVEVYSNKVFKIKLFMSYIKLSFDIQAFLQSIYQKLDLDMKVYQIFTGINRTLELIDNIYYIPLPKKLYDDLLLFDPTIDTKFIKVYYDYIGKEVPFVTYTYTPKLTLQSISDSSEKFGQDLIPYFKSSYSILAEGYVPTVLSLEFSLDTIPMMISSIPVSSPSGSQSGSSSNLFHGSPSGPSGSSSQSENDIQVIGPAGTIKDLSLLDSYLLLNALMDSYSEFMKVLNQLLSGSASDKYTAETFLEALLSTIEKDASQLTKFTPYDFANLLISLLEKAGVLTPQEITQLISSLGCSDYSLISVILLKKLLGLSYDDLGFIVSLFTDNFNNLIWLTSNLPTVEKNIQNAILKINSSFSGNIQTMDLKDLIVTYRTYKSKLSQLLSEQFLAYIIVKLFAYPLSNSPNFNYSKFVTVLSSKVTKQIQNRDQIIQNEIDLCGNLIFKSTPTSVGYHTCQVDMEYKYVIVPEDIDPGNYYSVNLVNLFNTTDLKILDIYVPNYEFYISENNLYIKGPIKKNTVITVIRFIYKT